MLHAQANAQEGNAVLSGVFALQIFCHAHIPRETKTRGGLPRMAFLLPVPLYFSICDVLSVAQVFTLYWEILLRGRVLAASGVRMNDSKMDCWYCSILHSTLFAHERYMLHIPWQCGLVV